MFCGLGFRIQDWGLGFGVSGVGFMVYVGFWGQDLGFRI